MTITDTIGDAVRPDRRAKSLAGRRLVITGASSGIGAATAFAAQGARLVLAARDAAGAIAPVGLAAPGAWLWRRRR